MKRPHRKSWTPEEDKMLLTLLDEGTSTMIVEKNRKRNQGTCQFAQNTAKAQKGRRATAEVNLRRLGLVTVLWNNLVIFGAYPCEHLWPSCNLVWRAPALLPAIVGIVFCLGQFRDQRIPGRSGDNRLIRREPWFPASALI
jgi:hypothetical protein